ncbi:MAG TPA: endonuclease III [Nitrospirae bacterium]|nr:endonuclease III [bacterium BMS3Bbin08]HDK82073.1 endonuclease III [Nitrospirota bacterium]HDO26045.1 endonuclease III [Nitrospirota bacterium]
MVDAKEIAKLLLKKYPDPKVALSYSSPFQLVIATILSAQCTDVRVNEVTTSLFKKYMSVNDFARADLRGLERDIRPTGFYKNKAKAIRESCRMIVKEFNGKVPDSMEELRTLPGVGRKTANVILGSAFGKQTIAVDTHVLRVSNRLGIAHSKNPDKVEAELVRQLPHGILRSFNLALILHGRETCKARKPQCSECVLYSECEWEGKVS